MKPVDSDPLMVWLNAEVSEEEDSRWPVGVLPTLAGASALGGARRGWTVRAHPSLLVLEAQTEGDQLVDLYLGLIERLPAADNLEVRVQEHFEDAGQADVWLTSRVNAKKVLRLLDDHDVDLIDNGHLELSVYVRAHKATLRLTEHKTVVWLAEGRQRLKFPSGPLSPEGKAGIAGRPSSDRRGFARRLGAWRLAIRRAPRPPEPAA